LLVSHYITLHHSDNCFEKQLLYIVSNYKRCQTDEFSAGV